MDYKKFFQRPIPASLWRRTFAYLIDAFIVAFVATYPLRSLFEDIPQQSFTSLFSFLQSHPTLTFRLAAVFLAVAFLSVLYWSMLEYKLRQSVGKLLLRITVVSRAKQLTFFQCFVRNIPKCWNVLLFFDVIYMLFKGGNQRFFEMISNTAVMQGDCDGKN